MWCSMYALPVAAHVGDSVGPPGACEQRKRGGRTDGGSETMVENHHQHPRHRHYSQVGVSYRGGWKYLDLNNWWRVRDW